MPSLFWFEVFKATTPPGVLMRALRDGLVPDPNQVRNGVGLLTSYLRSHQGRGFCEAPWHQGLYDKGDPSGWESVPVESATPSSVAAALLAAGADPYALSEEDRIFGVDAFSAAAALGMAAWLEHAVDVAPPQESVVSRWNQSSSCASQPSESTSLPWLHAWAQSGQPQMISALLAMGLDVNGVDFKGRTPLFFVRSAQEVALLVGAGANRAPLDKGGNPPQRLWENKAPEHIQEVSALLEHSAQESEKVLQAATIARMRDHMCLRLRHLSYKDGKGHGSKQMADWLSMLDASSAPVHAWRMPVPKGQLKGQWSLLGSLSMACLLHQGGHPTFGWEHILSRPDALTPDNHVGSKGLSEKGVLALALWLKADADFYAGSKYGSTSKKDKPDAHYLSLAQRLLDISSSLGDPSWVLSPQWLSSACNATLALRKNKSDKVADNLVMAWYAWARSIHVQGIGCASDFHKHPGHAFVRDAKIEDVLVAFEQVYRAGVALPTSAGELLIQMAPRVTPESGFLWAACMAWASRGAWLESGMPNGTPASAPNQFDVIKAMTDVLDRGVIIPQGFEPDDALWSEWEKLVPNYVHSLRALKLDQVLQNTPPANPRVRM